MIIGSRNPGVQDIWEGEGGLLTVFQEWKGNINFLKGRESTFCLRNRGLKKSRFCC